MADWNPPSDVSLAPGKPGRSSHIIAIRDLAEALAQRATGSPYLNAATTLDILTTSGTYVVPSGVYRIRVFVTGGGGSGGTDGSDGNDGGNSNFQHPDQTITGPGGGGGDSGTTGGGNDGTSGTGTGGDVNFTGSKGPWSDLGGQGGVGITGGGPEKGGDGGDGGTAIKLFAVTPGQNINYAIGAGGAAVSGSGAGQDGYAVVEY